ncbi:replication-relaxation family protein [[Kitasatospora] papulosa]|uniref:replication-relaxation family protein n=1 Tax=[Kitasatospora] papulosa TaxID=1464011 RepID=UPI0036C3B0AD
MTTEVGLPVSGTEAHPGRGSLQADLVLAAPEHQLPLLFVEVDRSTMVPERVAEKIRRYQLFLERRDNRGQLWWRSRWYAPENTKPVVALVLSGRSEMSVLNRARVVMNLVSTLHPTFPVIGTTLNRLTERGPWGETWWNAAHGGAPPAGPGAGHGSHPDPVTSWLPDTAGTTTGPPAVPYALPHTR